MYRGSFKSHLWKIFKRSLGIGLAAEFVFLAGSYAVWHRMNTNSDSTSLMASIYVYVKSTLWLIGCSALGYALLKVTEPKQDKLRQIGERTTVDSLAEDKRKTALALKKLREAVDDKPIYLKTRQEIEEQNRKNLGLDK
ncbi:uncharacterized protein LOC129788651 isoform X1 [Lutzomyia longipalpis]|nr:uncharacterized protein LOC129788651 isoform X1 [Lutzomyia longipalpis]